MEDNGNGMNYDKYREYVDNWVIKNVEDLAVFEGFYGQQVMAQLANILNTLDKAAGKRIFLCYKEDITNEQ